MEARYVLPFLDEEERKKLELEEKENKKLREKIALEEFENYKKYRDRKKKSTQLIYDNSYLFDKNDKEDKANIKQEVLDILAGKYNSNSNNNNSRYI